MFPLLFGSTFPIPSPCPGRFALSIPARFTTAWREHLEAIARDRGGVPDLPGGGERSLQSTLRRGWMFGGEAFREGLIERLNKLKESAGAKRRHRSVYTGGAVPEWEH